MNGVSATRKLIEVKRTDTSIQLVLTRGNERHKCEFGYGGSYAWGWTLVSVAYGFDNEGDIIFTLKDKAGTHYIYPVYSDDVDHSLSLLRDIKPYTAD